MQVPASKTEPWLDPLDQLDSTGALEVERFITFKANQLSTEFERQWTRYVREKAGVSLSQWRAMAVLQSGALTFAALVEATGINKALMSRSVRELETMRLINVVVTPNDGRSITLDLSGKGRGLLKELMPLALKRQRSLLCALTTAERRAFYSAVDKLRLSAKRWNPDD